MFTVQWFRLGGCVAHTLMRRYMLSRKVGKSRVESVFKVVGVTYV